MRSTLEGLEESQLPLCLGGRLSALNEVRGSQADCLHTISTGQIRQLHKLNLRHVGDLIHVEADKSGVWKIDSSAEWLLGHLSRAPPNCNNYLLWPGQTWQVHNMGDTKTIEIMDVASHDNIRVKHWKTVDGDATRFIMGDTAHVTYANLFADITVGHRLDIIKTDKTSGKSVNLRHTITAVQCPSNSSGAIMG